MKKLLVILLAVQLACGFNVGNPVGTAVGTPKPLPTQVYPLEHARLYVVSGNVYVRECPKLSCAVVETLEKSRVISAVCIDGEKFCRVPNGYVSAACLGFGGKCLGK